MSNNVSTSATLDRVDLLPGYVAIEKLGSGGYGEVWKAEAPGGLIKAVKQMYGFSHEQRASDELKALERVKQVRHPFLLSLERIETIDDRLFIVTELADESLKDCFNSCVRRGKNGIPRADLLSYLRDAADALDFMSEVHGLQHLDIKPENLLLVAGHIKVADFGLVKDVAKQNVSFVGGMTPVYSAPEVFHGRPSRYSDQYGLAVVYQQMLTGSLPFAGVSAAELALQHINEEPDLASLPAGDRPAIARALSKNPEHRFASCRTMIDALLEGDGSVYGPNGAAPPIAANRSNGKVEEASDFHLTLGRSAQTKPFHSEEEDATTTANAALEFPELEPASVESVCAPEVDPEGFQAVPTLLVGVGGAAGAVLRRFKRRVSERFGDASNLPAIATLLIDTDSSDLLEATHGSDGGRLAPCETLAVPLQRPQEYRNRHGQPFRWLSRRWLYNIPKSLKTEGLRPLGRLAFVDHASAIRARLNKALDQVLDSQSLSESQAVSGLAFSGDRLRVYVVASICGGTGSGIVLDLAYLLRSLIEKRDVSCEGITGIMLVPSPQRPRERELAAVNAFAWLTEYNHFNRPGAAFPGDTSCGLEPCDVNEQVFRHSYIVRLSEGAREGQADPRADGVAEYIYLDTLSPVQSFLESCRGTTPCRDDACGEYAPLSTFGVAVQDVTRDREAERVSAELAQKAVMTWLGSQPERKSEPVDGSEPAANVSVTAPLTRVEQACVGEAVKLQLEGRQLVAVASKLLELELRATPRGFFQRLVVELRGSRDTVSTPALLQAADRIFGGPASAAGGSQGEDVVLRQPLNKIVQPITGKMEAHLSRWLCNRLDDSEFRLGGALDAATWFISHLRQLNKTLTARSAEAASAIAASFAGLSSVTEQDAASKELVYKYFQLRLDRAATHGALLIARSLIATATSIRDELVTAGGKIRRITERLKELQAAQAASAEVETDSVVDDDTRRRLAQALLSHEEEWVEAVNARVNKELTKQGWGLYHWIAGNGAMHEKLTATVLDAARLCVRSVASDGKLLDRLLGTSEAVGERLEVLLSAARPDCLDFGGSVCHVIASPSGADWQAACDRVAALQRDDLSLVKHPENQLTACTEVSNVSLPHLAIAIIRNRRDHANLAQRILTRKDVPWSSLTTYAMETHAKTAVHTIML